MVNDHSILVSSFILYYHLISLLVKHTFFFDYLCVLILSLVIPVVANTYRVGCNFQTDPTEEACVK